jgi:hypothetical protein
VAWLTSNRAERIVRADTPSARGFRVAKVLRENVLAFVARRRMKALNMLLGRRTRAGMGSMYPRGSSVDAGISELRKHKYATAWVASCLHSLKCYLHA